MCGIFCCVGKNVVEKTIAGLQRLEYRGYDSSGIAGIDHNGNVVYRKEVGKVQEMASKVTSDDLDFDVAISQTRWATHGRPSQINAHPHIDTLETLAVVHNGIIENHLALRTMLEVKGVVFRSDTDTEVIAHLVADFYDGDILKAFQQAVLLLRGAFAIALIHKDFPDRILVAAKSAPIVIGVGHGENFVASDVHAFRPYSDKAVFLDCGDVAVVKADSYELYDSLAQPITKELKVLIRQSEDVAKGDYEHFTLKEIHEQPQTLRTALLSRCLPEYGNAIFDELQLSSQDLSGIDRVIIIGCGTSMHAGMVGAMILEEIARVDAHVVVASEFRYRNPVLSKGTLAIAISQSGETADTIAAVREIKARGCIVIGMCNVYESTLSRESDATIFLRAGPEMGVCSTKAFTNQVAVLSLFALMMARMRHMGKEEGIEFLSALQYLPEQIQQVLDQEELIEGMAKKYAAYSNFFYIGRQYMYPAALEGALKVKEIAYVNANGYPGGELKHGPIALISEECPTVALCANKHTLEKIISNLMEVKARGGPILAIAEKGTTGLKDVADDIIWVPSTLDALSVILTGIALQLFAYYVAYERGTDIDRPRNLAKSVTVE
jgi:glucosamine--fructose-6-phosphate aminotransferase (isomerizing)